MDASVENYINFVLKENARLQDEIREKMDGPQLLFAQTRKDLALLAVQIGDMEVVIRHLLDPSVPISPVILLENRKVVY